MSWRPPNFDSDIFSRRLKVLFICLSPFIAGMILMAIVVGTGHEWRPIERFIDRYVGPYYGWALLIFLAIQALAELNNVRRGGNDARPPKPKPTSSPVPQRRRSLSEEL